MNYEQGTWIQSPLRGEKDFLAHAFVVFENEGISPTSSNSLLWKFAL